MLPVILGIGAAIANTAAAVSVGKAVAIGAAIAVGANMLMNNQKKQGHDGVVPSNPRDDELEELVELLKERRRRMKKKV